jgi:hypothetical protein
MFQVNNLGPCSTSSLRHVFVVTTPKGDDDEFEVFHIYTVCIRSLPGRRGKYLLFMKHFNDDNIPPTCMAPVERGISHDGVTRFSGDASIACVCLDSGVHRLHARSPNAHSRVPLIASVKELRPLRLASRLASLLCQEGEGTSVSCNNGLHDIVHVLVNNVIHAFPSEVRTTWLRCNFN